MTSRDQTSRLSGESVAQHACYMSDHDPTQPRLIRFGLFEVDLAARELRRSGATVKLQDRPFEVLRILIEQSGEVVTREEFRRLLWSEDTFVNFDTSLNTSINKLRQALSDSAENPRFIATAGRRGYRFIAPTTLVDAATAEPQPLTRPLLVDDAELKQPQSLSPRSPNSRRSVIFAAAAAVLIAAVVMAALRPEPVPKVTQVVQLSHDGLVDPWGRLTTDGARLFFLNRIGGHWNLMQLPASGGEAQPFSEPSRNLRIVDISPDRSQLVSFAFSGRSADLPLSLTPVVGGSSRRVGDIVADDAVFTPDGRRLVFDRPDGIYFSDRDGSHLQKLVALPDRSEDPRWSKDGRRLRFTLLDRKTGSSSIWEVFADGTNLHAVDLHLPTSDPRTQGATCCGRWSSDGRYFFFTSIRDRVQSIWAISDSVRWWTPRPPSPVQLTFGPNNYGGLVSDTNPGRVFVWSGIEQLEMGRYNPASGRVQPLVPGVQSPNAALSPDGRWLAYATGGELWRSTAGGNERKPLISGFPPIRDIQWSPDGKRILFSATESVEPWKWFIVSADGGPESEVSLAKGRIEPTWFPDGEKIAFAKWATEGEVTQQESGIFLYDLRTAQTTKIPGSEGLVHASFSPDLKYLAAITNFDQNPVEPTRVKLFDTRAQSWVQIGQGTLVNPVQWSADSKFFYYQDMLSEGEQSYRYSIATHKSEPNLDFAGLLNSGYVRCSFKQFAPDGTVVVALRRNEVNLYRLDLDLP